MTKYRSYIVVMDFFKIANVYTPISVEKHTILPFYVISLKQNY